MGKIGFWEDYKERTWGDGSADIFGVAVDKVIAKFTADQGIAPTKAELRAGLEFTLGPMDELKEE